VSLPHRRRSGAAAHRLCTQTRPLRHSLSLAHPAGAAETSALASTVAEASGDSFADSLASLGSMTPPHCLYPSVIAARRSLHDGWRGDGYSASTSSDACRPDGFSAALAIAQPAQASARSSPSQAPFIQAGRFPIASRWWPSWWAKRPNEPSGP
jgi:hypothetical protein